MPPTSPVQRPQRGALSKFCLHFSDYEFIFVLETNLLVNFDTYFQKKPLPMHSGSPAAHQRKLQPH